MSPGAKLSTPFSKIAGQTLVAAVIGYAINLVKPEAPIALAINAICIWRLYSTAERYSSTGVEGFDAIVAAEAIVGFGIACLVMGLGSVGLLFVFGQLHFASANGELNLLAGMPFIEGLFTAGVAPFFAILLRLRVVEQGEIVDAADDMASLSRAAASLTRTLRDAHAALGGLQSGAEAAASSASNLAATMESEAPRLEASLKVSGSSMANFGTTSKTTSSDIAALSSETTKLKVAVVDATSMLSELSRLIETVQRFVDPKLRKDA